MTTPADERGTAEPPRPVPSRPAGVATTCAPSLRQGVQALTASLDDALAAELWRASDAEVRQAVLAVEVQAARLEAVRLRLLAAADERSVGASTGAPTTADWLVGATTTRAEHARRRVALATALQTTLALTGKALAAGTVGADQVGVVHTAMDRLHPAVDQATRADAEAFLLQQAAHLDPRRLAYVARHLTARLDPGAEDDLARTEARQERQRQVRCTQTDDGTWLLHGLLDPVGGATLMAALEPLAAPRPASDGTPDLRPHPRRLADALVTVADAHLAGHTGTGASRPRLLVTVPLATVLDPAAPGVAPGQLPGGAPVSGEQVSLLACDAELTPVLVDDDGTPLDVGRTMYAWPDRVRTAVWHRDQTCTFPGCTRPAPWGHIHHLTPYSKGGRTSERNGAALCGHHHRYVHRHGWRGQLLEDRVAWHPPDREHPLLPAPPWRPPLERLVQRWRTRTPRRADASGCAA